MGLNKNQLHQLKESLKAGSFCKQWWKNLQKLLKDCDISDYQRIMIYSKLANGLRAEAWKLCVSEEDKNYFNSFLEESGDFYE